MDTINTFLRALEKILNSKLSPDNKIFFVSRWENIKDSKFPAYTKYTLEVVEYTRGKEIERFLVRKTHNLYELKYIDNPEEVIKEDIVGEMIQGMLKYYMYGNVVQ